MAITFRGVTAIPADNGANSDAGGSISVPTNSGVLASCVTGDLVCLLIDQRDGAPALSVSDAAGQSITAENLVSASSSNSTRLFWFRFDGTWDSANVVIATDKTAGSAITAAPIVFVPSSSANTWSVEVAQQTHTATPTTPFDVTVSGQTPAAASTVTLVWWANTNVPATTWALQTAGWDNPNSEAQWRNTQGSDSSLSAAYKIQTSAAATGSVVNRQLTGTGIFTEGGIITFRENQAAGVARIVGNRAPLRSLIYAR